MSEPGTTPSIDLAWDLDHAPEKVWRALTDPELLALWLMTNDLQPEAGHNFTFRQEPTPWWDGVVHCEVLEIEPRKCIRYTWKSGSGPSGLDTVVTWTLTPRENGGTRLALEQTGFTSSHKFAFDGARDGWQRMVRDGLVGLLDRAGGTS